MKRCKDSSSIALTERLHMLVYHGDLCLSLQVNHRSPPGPRLPGEAG